MTFHADHLFPFGSAGHLRHHGGGPRHALLAPEPRRPAQAAAGPGLGQQPAARHLRAGRAPGGRRPDPGGHQRQPGRGHPGRTARTAADHVITEPMGRNTAPCAVLGMGLAGRLDPAAPVALLPADHFIPDDDIFRDPAGRGLRPGRGRRDGGDPRHPPDRPETGYGYLETAGDRDTGLLSGGWPFVEKPDPATAEDYVRSGRHFWNSGIFVWNPGLVRERGRPPPAEVVGPDGPAGGFLRNRRLCRGVGRSLPRLPGRIHRFRGHGEAGGLPGPARGLPLVGPGQLGCLGRPGAGLAG